MRQGVLLIGGVAVLCLTVLIALSFGTVAIPLPAIAGILINATPFGHLPVHWPETSRSIILGFRLPRVLAGLCVGSALAVAGTLFQGLLRNPLADPYILGISSGAALGATIGFFIPGLYLIGGVYGVPCCAFVGAVLAIICVYWLARVEQRTPVVTLILAGVAVSALLGAVQTVIISQFATEANRIGGLFGWLSGNLAIAGGGIPLPLMVVLIGAGITGAILLAPLLDTFALGEDAASFLGIGVEQVKLVVVGVAALLVACAVSLSGLVGFVGLFVPHVCRLVLGPRHRTLIPATALVGAVFVVWADLLARVLLQLIAGIPSELPLGVITALVGGPFFLWLLRQQQAQHAV